MIDFEAICHHTAYVLGCDIFHGILIIMVGVLPIID